MMVACFPMIFKVAKIVAELVAGPTMRNTRTAPGEIPALRKAKAKGRDSTAHT